LAGIFCKARIPLKEAIHIGNGPSWMANATRPDLIHQQVWAVDQAGDTLSHALSKPGSSYRISKEIKVEGAPAVMILRRADK
jgi:hypothetical protein